MPKKIKNCFSENLNFTKFMEAHQRARQHKVYKNEVISFEINLENNITNLVNSIKNGTYHLGKYYSFKIYEPKERIIKALPYRDRIVHQWYVEEFIKPYIVPRFIKNSFACLKDKGTHAAVEEVHRELREFKRRYGDFWILKCDIKKFFYTIDPYILFNIMKKYISDKQLLDFTHLIIFDGRNSAEQIGIPIGNYTSQFFANIYLNELDQYIKHVLKVKYYVRYMDDFVILVKSKNECISLKKQISEFLHKHLHLSLNDKTRYYPYPMGVNFCGYRIFTTHRLLRTNSKKKIKRKIQNWNKHYAKNNLDFDSTIQSLNSWLGHSSHCNSYTLQKKMINSCDFLINSKYLENVETELINLIEKDVPPGGSPFYY